MVEFLITEDPWVEGGSEHPILGSDQKFFFDYSVHETDYIHKILLEHHDSDELRVYTSLHRFCNDCYQCYEDKDKTLDERYQCTMYPQYYFFEFECARSKKTFYLISYYDDPSMMPVEDWIFIPAHTHNIQIFNTNYLGGQYHVGI